MHDVLTINTLMSILICQYKNERHLETLEQLVMITLVDLENTWISNLTAW